MSDSVIEDEKKIQACQAYACAMQKCFEKHMYDRNVKMKCQDKYDQYYNCLNSYERKNSKE